jgi:hypothetical protein
MAVGPRPLLAIPSVPLVPVPKPGVKVPVVEPPPAVAGVVPAVTPAALHQINIDSSRGKQYCTLLVSSAVNISNADK